MPATAVAAPINRIPYDDLEDVVRAARDMGADLIVLDTLARTFGDGDENAARDMGGFVASVNRLRAETGAHVAVVHHGTKEGGSSRGSGALVGAADLIVKVARGAEAEANRATVEAAKDDADGAVLPFRLRVVCLPAGPDGEARQTCVAEEADAPGAAARERVRCRTNRNCCCANCATSLLPGKRRRCSRSPACRPCGLRPAPWCAPG